MLRLVLIALVLMTQPLLTNTHTQNKANTWKPPAWPGDPTTPPEYAMNYTALSMCNREYVQREMWDEVLDNILSCKVKLSDSEKAAFFSGAPPLHTIRE